MRVLILNLGYPPNTIGGAELLVQLLAREFVRRGIRTSVVSLSQNKTDWQYNDEGVRAYFINAHPMGIALLNPQRTALQKLLWHALGEANIWVARKLDAILKKERPDIVHSHSLLGLSVGAWRVAEARGVPIVHTLQDYQLLCPRGTMFRRGQPCAQQCHACALLTLRRRRASAIPAAVVGISNFILQAHLACGYFPAAIPAVIPNSSTRPRVTVRSDGASVGPLRIGFIGRLHPIKGIELLIEALKRLPRERYIAKIAGSGNADYEARLKRVASNLPIDFPGWVRHGQFYDQIDVLVVPSVYNEPQGLVLLEAASFGVPTIYANRGGLGEMGAEFAGFLPFDPAVPESLSDKLRYLIDTPSALARLKASIGPTPEPYKIDALFGSYSQLYEQVLRAGITAPPLHRDTLSRLTPNV